MKIIDIKILPDGRLLGPYHDAVMHVAVEMGAEILSVKRASTVEWEEVDTQRGWVVRSCHDPELAIRKTNSGTGYLASREGKIAFFKSRSEALDAEMDFFWDLVPKTGP